MPSLVRPHLLLLAAVVVPLIHTNVASGQEELPEWQQMSYDLPEGRRFGYVFLLESKTGGRMTAVGGTVIFRAGEHVSDKGTTLSVVDNLQKGQLSELSATLPVESQMLASEISINTAHGFKNRMTVDGDLPVLLGNTFEWFFPRLPSGVGEKKKHEGYVNRTPNVRVPSYYNWVCEAVSEDSGVVQIKEHRLFKSNDPRHIHVEGAGVIEFDKNQRLVVRHRYRGVHKIHGKTSHVTLYAELISEEKLNAALALDAAPSAALDAAALDAAALDAAADAE